MAKSNVFVKPCTIDGQPALVRDPQTGKPLAAAGEWKTKNQFWIRRIAQGDVVVTTPPLPASSPAKPAPELKPSKSS